MTDLKPEDLVTRLQRLASSRRAGVERDIKNGFGDCSAGAEVTVNLMLLEQALSLLADRARMEKALRDALAALEPFAQHAMDIADAVDLTGGGQVEIFIDVADLLGALRVHARLTDADPWQDGSASVDGGAGVPVRSLSVQATDKSDRAEGVAALQQAGEPISRENLEAELRETIGLYVREAVTRMFSEENATYRCARQIAGMLQPGYYLHRKLFSSPLPQQTALVEQGVKE